MIPADIGVALFIILVLAIVWLAGRRMYAEIKRIRALDRLVNEPATYGDDGGRPRPPVLADLATPAFLRRTKGDQAALKAKGKPGAGKAP